MSAEQFTYLSEKNPHERDNHIVFDEPTHVYTVDGDSNYMSVTTFNHSHFEPIVMVDDNNNVVGKFSKKDKVFKYVLKKYKEQGCPLQSFQSILLNR